MGHGSNQTIVITKKGWSKAAILVCDSYPEWKINVLKWMQEQYSAETGFPATFMKDLKGWTGTNVEDKKLIKLSMQFASFVKREAEDVGPMAMDVQLPFDQKAILSEALEFIKKQVNVTELDIIKLGVDDTADVPDKLASNVMPGKPHLWLH